VVVTSVFQGSRWDVARAGTSLTASATESLTGVIPDDNDDPRDVILLDKRLGAKSPFQH
jgi:hypothetical protein